MPHTDGHAVAYTNGNGYTYTVAYAGRNGYAYTVAYTDGDSDGEGVPADLAQRPALSRVEGLVRGAGGQGSGGAGERGREGDGEISLPLVTSAMGEDMTATQRIKRILFGES